MFDYDFFSTTFIILLDRFFLTLSKYFVFMRVQVAQVHYSLFTDVRNGPIFDCTFFYYI